MKAAALLLLLLVPSLAWAKPKQVLFFTKASGNIHAVIKQEGGKPSLAEKVLVDLGAKNGFEITHSKDGRLFTPEGLARYDGFIFYTIGDLTTSGEDKNPPMPPGGKELLLDLVKKGKGFVGLHIASDTFLTPGDRFVANGEATDPYLKMLGGEFIWHGPQQKGRAFCVDARFPGFGECKDSFEWMEEWYSLKNFQPDLHVLLWMGTWSVINTGKGSVYRRPPYPLAWARMHGKGRVFYTALGHRDDVWANPTFQSQLAGGIKWSLGEVRADIKPNIKQVTPYYMELPPNDTGLQPGQTARPDGGAPPARD